MRVDTLKAALLACAASMTLAACGGGGSSVVSPGEGAFATGGTGGTTGGTGGSGTASASCPTGFTDLGVIAGGALRSCGIPATIIGDFTIPYRPGTAYRINGRVAVGEDMGADAANPIAGRRQGILRIEAGAVIFGGVAEYLVVNRGSQIFADGTASQPIVFTSVNDLTGGPRTNGQWGGLVIAGRAPINRCAATATTFPANPGLASSLCEYRFEAIQTIFWGGNAPTESSGRLRYVVVKEPGYEVAPNEELNGITFGAVGSGTEVSFVQVDSSADDAVEFFGGNVNSRYLVLTQWDDDGYDTDEGFTGSTQYMISFTDNPTEEDRCFEMSTAGSTSGGAPLLRSAPKVSNATCRLGLASTPFDSRQHQGIVLNSGTTADFINTIIYSANPAIRCFDVDAAATVLTPRPTLRSVLFSCAGGDFRTDGDRDAETADIFNTGSNNLGSASYTPSLTQVFINGATETARPAFTSVATVSPFFLSTSFVGAVNGSGDTWYVGWTCGLAGATAC